MRHIDDGRPVPRTAVAQQLARILREYDELPSGQGCFVAAEKPSGAFLGWLSLRPATSVGLRGGTELGYRMLPSVWGRGYATEGARALVHHAFTELEVNRIVATTMTVNTASRRVMERPACPWSARSSRNGPSPSRGPSTATWSTRSPGGRGPGRAPAGGDAVRRRTVKCTTP